MKEECQEEFNRENIWRELVSEANKNILDPSKYATKQEYYEELNVKLQQIRQQEIMQQQQESSPNIKKNQTTYKHQQ